MRFVIIAFFTYFSVSCGERYEKIPRRPVSQDMHQEADEKLDKKIDQSTNSSGDNSTGSGDNSTGSGDNSTGSGDNSTGSGDNSTGSGDNSTGSGEEELKRISNGLKLFIDPHDDGNTFACSSCHAESEQADKKIRRNGHPLHDAYLRKTFKNGQLSKLIDAVNSCRKEWMSAPEFKSTDSRWLDMSAYLKDLSQGEVGKIVSFEIAQPQTGKDLEGGSSSVGNDLFNKTCFVCHGVDAKGTAAGPALAGGSYTADLIAQRIRLSGGSSSPVYKGLTGGRMSFWSKSRMSDSEIRDIVAFLKTSDVVDLEETESAILSVPDAQSSCGKTHPLVGKTLSLSTKSHQVSGEARVVDDCTIELENFTFDGGGIDVRIYGGKDLGNFDLAISKNFFGTRFSKGKARFSLPKGVSLDDFNSISVWCVAVGFSFGDGQFR